VLSLQPRLPHRAANLLQASDQPGDLFLLCVASTVVRVENPDHTPGNPGNEPAVEISDQNEIFETAFGKLMSELKNIVEDHPLATWCTRPETMFAALRTLERIASRSEWLADADLADDAAARLLASSYRQTRIEVLSALHGDALREACDGAVPEIPEHASILQTLVAAELGHTAIRTWLDTPAWLASQRFNSKMTEVALEELRSTEDPDTDTEEDQAPSGQYL
jgi:hypothetical protein